MLQYLRKCSVRFNGGYTINPGGIQKHELKIGFSVEKDISSTANTATISIWNMAPGHRNAVGKEFDEIELSAGYMPPSGLSGAGFFNFMGSSFGMSGGNVGIIFKGNVRDVKHERDGPDIVTRIECGDGDEALRRGVTSKSFPKGTKVEDVVNELYSKMSEYGVTKGEWVFPTDMEPTYKRPYAMCGQCSREMDTIGRGKGFYWSVQNGAMEIIPSDGFIGQTIVLNSNSGLIDSPSVTDNGVQASALLNPEIRPNRPVQIESEMLQMNGMSETMFRVGACTYSGDNRDGDFRVDFHGETINGDKVDEGED